MVTHLGIAFGWANSGKAHVLLDNFQSSYPISQKKTAKKLLLSKTGVVSSHK